MAVTQVQFKLKKIRMTNSNLEMAKKVGDKPQSFRGIQLQSQICKSSAYEEDKDEYIYIGSRLKSELQR